MGDILRRRGMMALPSSSPTSEWDYEWDAGKGLLNANDNGFTVETIGSGGYGCSIVDDYMQWRGKSSIYRRLNYESVYQTGVMEAVICAAESQSQIQIAFSNGEHSIGARLQTSTNYNGIYLGNGLTTKLATAVTGTKYKVRLVLKTGLLGDVYIDDTLAIENADISSNTVTTTRVQGLGAGSGYVRSRLYSLKMKFNRTS